MGRATAGMTHCTLCLKNYKIIFVRTSSNFTNCKKVAAQRWQRRSELHSFPTSLNWCQHSTVLNPDVPNCYITPQANYSEVVITSAEGSYVFTSVCLSVRRITKQESCAIAKMTAQCALYMVRLKISGLPDYAHGYYSQHFSWAFVLIHLMNVPSKFEIRIALPVPEITGGTQKICAVPGYAHAPFSPKLLMGFYSDWPYTCTHQI